MPSHKALEGRDYSVTSFEVHNDQTYTYTSGSTSNPEQISVDLAIQPPENFLLGMATGSTLPGFVNDSGRYAYPTFSTTRHFFYNPSSSLHGFYPTSSCYVVGIGSNAFGEGIKPGTFSVEVVGSGTAIDRDGDGKLYISGTQIGNVFYDSGLAVIQRDEASGADSLDADGMSLVESGQAIISFSSTLTIYEHTVVCRIQPNEFNWTWNPSLISGSSEEGLRVYDQFASGSLVPYMTTFGLYNEMGELMAVAKLSQAIPRVFGTQQTVIVKFDT